MLTGDCHLPVSLLIYSFVRTWEPVCASTCLKLESLCHCTRCPRGSEFDTVPYELSPNLRNRHQARCVLDGIRQSSSWGRRMNERWQGGKLFRRPYRMLTNVKMTTSVLKRIAIQTLWQSSGSCKQTNKENECMLQDMRPVLWFCDQLSVWMNTSVDPGPSTVAPVHTPHFSKNVNRIAILLQHLHLRF